MRLSPIATFRFGCLSFVERVCRALFDNFMLKNRQAIEHLTFVWLVNATGTCDLWCGGATQPIPRHGGVEDLVEGWERRGSLRRPNSRATP